MRRSEVVVWKQAEPRRGFTVNNADGAFEGRKHSKSAVLKSARIKRKGRGAAATAEDESIEHLSGMLNALAAAADGDFSVRLKVPANDRGTAAQIGAKFNLILARNEAMAREIVRVEQAVRREGRMNE